MCTVPAASAALASPECSSSGGCHKALLAGNSGGPGAIAASLGRPPPALVIPLPLLLPPPHCRGR